MKIIFVDPPLKYGNLMSKWTPPCGYLYLSSYLKSKGFNEVKVLDAHIERVGWDYIREYILREKPAVIATNSMTADISERVRLLKIAKEVNPDITTVIGGHHASLVPEEVLRLGNCVDYVIVGEGEIAFYELVMFLKNGGERKPIPGIAYLSGNDYVYGGERCFIENLDDLPMPDYSLVPVEKYRIFELPGSPYAGTDVTFSRGCGNYCAFCSEAKVWRNRQRSRSPEKMVEELAILYTKYGKKNFIFGDADFLFNRERTAGFIRSLKERGLKIKYTIMTRAQNVIKHRDLLSELRDSGLVMLGIGAESYSEDVLKSLRKGQRACEVLEACKLVHEAKIPLLRLYMIWGTNEEKRGEWLKMLRVSRSLNADFLSNAFLTPFPGTELYIKMKSEGLIHNFNYRAYGFFVPVVRNIHYSLKQLFIIQQIIHFLWWYHPYHFLRSFTNRYRFHLQFFFLPRLTKMVIGIIIKVVLRR